MDSRDPIEVTVLLVPTHSEVGALSVAVEILREIGRHDEADRPGDGFTSFHETSISDDT